MTRFDISVPTFGLRAAVMAVLPHAEVLKELTTLRRLRVYVSPDDLKVVATDAHSIGVASVELLDTTGELGVFDLSPEDATTIVGLFKPPKELLGDAVLRIQATEKSLTITDISGMFEAGGETELQLPPMPIDDQFPDVTRVFESVAMFTGTDEPSPYLVVNGKRLARFDRAASAYGEPLVIEPLAPNKALLITCSSSFIGLLAPWRPDAEDVVRYGKDRANWFEGFTEMRSSHPVPPSVSTEVPGGLANAHGFMEPVDLDEAPDSDAPPAAFMSELVEHAQTWVIANQSASSTKLAKALGVGKSTVAQLLARLEERGIVGPQPIGNEARIVMVTGELS